ncbi:MAG: hypothetical protein JWO77_1127 [Ilumatobacteraceae bacterium]|nr:hypothetical protein [Ilumatobacteraceae bacterium]
MLVPTAISQTAVSAVEQDLVVSATSGAAGTEVTVTSASCDTAAEGNVFRYLNVRLLAGTAPDQVLAGSALGIENEEAIIIVPDWLDPTEPAVIEAQCIEFELSDEDEAPPLQTLFTFDPVAFDVEASPGAPVQERTYSRTSLLAGQAFSVEASGCFLSDASSSAYVDVVAGSDLTFPLDAESLYFSGEGELDGGSFSVITALSNGGVDFFVSGAEGEADSVEIEEFPTDVPAGTYSSVAYCTRGDGATLMFEPELIEVTGDAPFADVDLTVPAESRTATVAGGSCTAGDVDALLWGADLDDFDEEFLHAGPSGPGPALLPAAARGRTGPSASSLLLGSRTGGRSLSDDPVELIVTPAADGSWSSSHDAGFDHGLVGSYAMCGDPLADGFLYDDQAADVSVTEVPPTVPPTAPPTVPPTVPTPAPANAVAGSPTYAG